MQPHDHLVHIDEARRELIIYRVDEHGRRSLFTSVVLPSAEEAKRSFHSFARQLGEHLLFDSEAARKLLDL